ncbi:DUF4062 domain-containing protein [Salinibacterium sp. UTAS2018]|uniref:DUF4062 domain-containing protein n=1 Tax=Salinibacterium sp. UTAS2018 TaxID=2508880 RepID=UPI001009630F|nr:DUF4062 domain-containing protein [Salinibacterium sp. UTAS2018]QAV69737.1 DUF4062 domain-containing protein [Salinibacterium sp. UTAS2018]
MPFAATVVRVMIASPSDVPEARNAVEKAVHGWNDANAAKKGVILHPWRWETSAVPVLGGHPQALINAQGLDSADVVIALFGSRLGSPTADAVSGTVEEIGKASDGGKPVHVYFSTEPLPYDVDTKQLEGLRVFKEQIQTAGLYGEFSNPSQLEHEVWKAIEHDLASMALDGPVAAATAKPSVEFEVQPGSEAYVKYNSKGVPKNATRRWIDVTNVGTTDAEGVTFQTAGEHGGFWIGADDEPTIVHKGQTRRIGIELMLVAGAQRIVRVTWVEDGEEKSKDFHI